MSGFLSPSHQQGRAEWHLLGNSHLEINATLCPKQGEERGNKEDGGGKSIICPIIQKTYPAEKRGTSVRLGQPSLHLIPFISPTWEGQVIQARVGNVLAPSPELHSTPSTLLPGPYIYISLYMYIHAHTCTHTKRGPCNFHIKQEEGGEGKK